MSEKSRQKIQQERGRGGLIPYEVALDQDGNLQQGSPWSDAAVKTADIGNYFFYPKGRTDFIDIIVLARNEYEAHIEAQKEVEYIKKAGKWGTDHLKR